MSRKLFSLSLDVSLPDTGAWPRLVQVLLPSPGNVLFTLLVVAGLLWATNAGALPLRSTQYATSSSTGTIAYQGRLADSAGNPITNTVNMEFRLYDVAEDGAPLWSELWTGANAVRVSDGLFNVMLGSLTPISQGVIAGNDNLWLGITVGTDDEMTPRVQLGSVPFAVQALTVPDGSVSTAKLANGAVTSAKIQDGQVGTTDLANNAVNSAKIQDGEVGNADLANNAVNSAKIQDGQVSNADLANNVVTSAKIKDGQVGTADIANNAVNSAKIQDGQVTTGDLANGAVTAAKININDHLDMHKKDIFNIANLVFPYNDARAIKYRGSGPYGLAIQTVNDSGQDIVRMELGVGNYPNVHITNARLDMNGNPIINQGAMVEAGLQTADELAAERIARFEKGDVLCWAGKRLEKCNRANDRRVVAVADENGKPIVIGAELIKVLGPVQVGDLLVAADVAGYAMVNNQPAPGTVIAKALESFAGERGTIKAMIRNF